MKLHELHNAMPSWYVVDKNAKILAGPFDSEVEAAHHSGAGKMVGYGEEDGNGLFKATFSKKR
jgi:hypothetical protein